MSHAIHKTQGIILDILPYKESGQMVKVFSHELGVLNIFANGVRDLKGKLRYNLQILNFCDFDFVEGKEVKRLTGVQEILNYKNVLLNSKKRKIFSNIVNLTIRLVGEDIPNESLYESFESILIYLSITTPAPPLKGGDSTPQDFEIVEIISVIKILFHTGYWHEEMEMGFTEQDFKKVTENKKEIIEKINKSIKSTQL